MFEIGDGIGEISVWIIANRLQVLFYACYTLISILTFFRNALVFLFYD
jgi:hypothetical protein